MRALPRYPVTVVGSLPRPSWLLAALRRKSPELAELRDRAALQAIRLQEEAGVDLLSDGEMRRDNFHSFLAGKLAGVQLMTLAELLEHVEDKAAFETLLQALDVPAFALKNPVAIGPLARRGPLVGDEAAFVRAHSTRALKVALPGPYLLSRSMWVQSLSRESYPTREALADDVVRVLREELLELAAAGVDCVQFDEPVLSEVVFAGKAATRTFMCAALAASASPEEELELAVELVNRVVADVRGTRTALHVCRGNWSQQEDVLLAGSYEPLLPYFARMRVDQLVLEYATPRAGPPELLARLPAAMSFGFGCVNPRTESIEDPSAIAERVLRLEQVLGPGRVSLNPDCGFGTFADRPVASEATAAAKLRALFRAAELLRARG